MKNYSTKNQKSKKNNNSLVKEQLSLFSRQKVVFPSKHPSEKFIDLLKSDLNFHNLESSYSSHNFHSFPAKFPPQLPKLFIEELTHPNDVVLDPMVGSGTTVIEAYSAYRKGIGFDIDPLAIKIAKVKTTPFNKRELLKLGSDIFIQAKADYIENKEKLEKLLIEYFDPKTREFLDYWFLKETQLELISLRNQINAIKNEFYRLFFEVILSSVIITKSGGVSLALDLGHTRPHKVKALLDSKGNIIHNNNSLVVTKKSYQTKNIKSAIAEFRKRFNQNINSIISLSNAPEPIISCCDSQKLSLASETIDLIVTSPPYASNAIDYMRAHKFSLVWLGFALEELTKKRNEYIGSESTTNYIFEELPEFTCTKIAEISAIDLNRGKVLTRYFSEMKKSLSEMYRVLKPQRIAIIVLGSSIMKGVNTETHICLQEIGKSLGFTESYIGIRELDRNKRMLPASREKNMTSQIQQRMHEEYVIGFYKD